MGKEASSQCVKAELRGEASACCLILNWVIFFVPIFQAAFERSRLGGVRLDVYVFPK